MVDFTFGGRTVSADTPEKLLWYLRDDGKGTAGGGTDKDTEPVHPTPVNDPPPPLFGLTVGINKYKVQSHQLFGCVSDADDVAKYLRETLNTPPENIVNLRNDAATRQAILSELEKLSTNPRIQFGDAIVIFFATHGTETDTPEGWGNFETEHGKTQFVIAHDSDFLDPVTRKVIPPIPDRTIGALLNKIAKAKGDNITFIMDLCHSGGGTRDGKTDPGIRSRYYPLVNPVPSDVDIEIWGGSRDSNIPPGFLRTGLASHVLLAGCGHAELTNERSYKGHVRGDFTRALTEILRALGPDKVTYKDVLPRMKRLPGSRDGPQNPQCEGVNQDRILFNGKVPSGKRVYYHVVKVKDGKFTLDAGAAHGITRGAQFLLYAEKESPIRSPPLGKFVADEIGPFTTTITIPAGAGPIAIPVESYAVLSKLGAREDLRLHVDFKGENIIVYQAISRYLQNVDTNLKNIRLVSLSESPHLAIEVDEENVVYDIFDPNLVQAGAARIPNTTEKTPEAVFNVIAAAAHFYWHLELNNDDKAVNSKVRLEFFEVTEVEGEIDENGMQAVRPGENINKGGIVHLESGPEKAYGFRIISTASQALYPCLFFFDTSNLEIKSFYRPGSTGEEFVVDPPLLPATPSGQSSLPIGFEGGAGWPLRTFSVAEGAKVNVGYLKLFLTDTYVDYSDIVQSSPFAGGRDEVIMDKRKVPQVWSTMIVPVIQRKEKN